MRLGLPHAAGVLILGSVLGALAYAAVQSGAVAGPSPTADAGVDPALEAEVDRLRRVVADLEAELAEARAATPPSSAADPESAAASDVESTRPGAINPGLDPDLARRATVIRADLEAQMAAAVATARAQRERERAEEARRAEQERLQAEGLNRDTAVEWLRTLKKDFTAPWDLLASDRFEGLFAARVKGALRDGASLRVGASVHPSSPVLGEGEGLVYPAGRFRLDILRLVGGAPRKAPLVDVTIAGAGMDATLVEWWSSLDVRGAVERLTLRDLTILTRGSLSRMRNEPLLLRLERCRLIGFDSGAGGSSLFGDRVGGIEAVDCRFESGFGRSPDTGTVFDVRGALVARFTRCVVRGPMYSTVGRLSGNAAVLYRECRFENASTADARVFEKGSKNHRFLDCTLVPLPEDFDSKAVRTRPLADLNPAWGEQKR